MSRHQKPHLRCPACRLHLSICICGELPRLDTRTRVVVLIHQLELNKPTNTGLLAARCLSNSTVAYHGRAPDSAAPDGAAPASIPSSGYLLFPHPDAIPLDSTLAAGAPLTLVVPDGTWRQAARMRAKCGLPCVTLPGARATGTRLRTPVPAHPERLATLEALALALGVLEGPAVEETLRRVYRMFTERTLWTNGRVMREHVTGGIPAGARAHDPLGLGPPPPSPGRRSPSAS